MKKENSLYGISAIIATINRTDELRRLFKTFILNECHLLEVIVVDQNCNDLIDNLIKEFSESLNLVHIKLKEPNQSAARNLGVAKAKYPIICFPDDDCWFEKNSIKNILSYFTNHPKTDLLILNWFQNPSRSSISMNLSKKKICSFKAPIGYNTYSLVYKKDTFIKLGGFKETIGLGKYIGGGEDSELIFRTSLEGYEIFHDHTIIVNHKYSPTFARDVASIRSRERGTGFIYYYHKLPKFIVLKGLFSPFLKMFTSFKSKNLLCHYNVLAARIEGISYAMKYKNIMKKNNKTIL